MEKKNSTNFNKNNYIIKEELEKKFNKNNKNKKDKDFYKNIFINKMI